MPQPSNTAAAAYDSRYARTCAVLGVLTLDARERHARRFFWLQSVLGLVTLAWIFRAQLASTGVLGLLTGAAIHLWTTLSWAGENGAVLVWLWGLVYWVGRLRSLEIIENTASSAPGAPPGDVEHFLRQACPSSLVRQTRLFATVWAGSFAALAGLWLVLDIVLPVKTVPLSIPYLAVAFVSLALVLCVHGRFHKLQASRANKEAAVHGLSQ